MLDNQIFKLVFLLLWEISVGLSHVCEMRPRAAAAGVAVGEEDGVFRAVLVIG